MKKTAIFLFALLTWQTAFSQEDHSVFASEVMQQYQRMEATFRQEALNNFLSRRGASSEALSDSVDFILIPDLYLKKHPRKFYQKADPAKLIEYIDPQAMHMSIFIPTDSKDQKINLSPNADSTASSWANFRDELHAFYVKYQPELIFGVCNLPSYFVILDGTLQAIRFTEEGAVPQTIDEYRADHSEDIAIALSFGYQPLYEIVDAGGADIYLLFKAVYGNIVRGVFPESVNDYQTLGKLMDRGAELIGVYDGLSVNIVQISISKKLKTFGGGSKLQMKGTTVWDPRPGMGYVPGPKSFDKVTYIVY